MDAGEFYRTATGDVVYVVATGATTQRRGGRSVVIENTYGALYAFADEEADKPFSWTRVPESEFVKK